MRGATHGAGCGEMSMADGLSGGACGCALCALQTAGAVGGAVAGSWTALRPQLCAL